MKTEKAEIVGVAQPEKKRLQGDLRAHSRTQKTYKKDIGTNFVIRFSRACSNKTRSNGF